MPHIIIIGNGISGITAARNIRKKSDSQITVIAAETEHFFSRTALMYIYMGHMKFEHTKPYEDWFWKKNKIDLVQDYVERIHTHEKKLTLQSGQTLSYDTLIIATGSVSNKFDWPGQDLNGVQGLYSYQDLLLMEENTKNIKHAVIVGGGLIGVEVAEMLHSRNIPVTMLVRESSFWDNVLPVQESKLISKHIESHGINILFETELKEIKGNSEKRVTEIITSHGNTIPCEFVVLATGVSPNISFLKDSGIDTKRGILVDEHLQTSIPNVYAIGDCVERTYALAGRKTVEQVWYTGRMMGEVLAETICGTPTQYHPGPWFNSAKFFDIEYQTYGNVSNVLKDDEDEFYWEHASGNKAMHFIWNKNSKEFIGINTFGIRLRHACFDRWLNENKSIDFIMKHLAEANFDPEFFDRHEKEIVGIFSKSNFQTV